VTTHSTPIKIIGFDFGHAQTAVATVLAGSREAPGIVTLHNLADESQVHTSAVARYIQDGETKTIVGRRCFGMAKGNIAAMPAGVVDEAGVSMQGAPDRHLAFKSEDIRPGTRSRYATGLFIEGVMRQLMADPVVLPAGTRGRWVFGVPSGWSPGTRDAYETMLQEAVGSARPGDEVMLIAESRAAMLASREELRASRRRKAASTDGFGSTLIIDIGSLTTDYTYVAEQRETPQDAGLGRFGAGLIDKKLRQEAISRHMPKRDHARLRQATEDDSDERMSLEFACRLAKERYYRSLEQGASSGDGIWASEAVRVAGGEIIEVQIPVTEHVMSEVLGSSLDDASDYHDLGWREAFRENLADVRASLEEKHGHLPRTILLTGGPSRMPFVQEICREVFECGPDGEPGRKFILGTEPEYVIAKGLALAGQVDYRVSEFLVAADEFARAKVPELIKDNLSRLADALGEVSFAGLVEEQVIPAVIRWRNGEIKRLNDVPEQINQERQRYLASEDGIAKQTAAISGWYRSVAALINQEASIIARDHDVPTDGFKLPLTGAGAGGAEADINVKGALAVMRTVANTTASVLTLATAAITVAVISVILDAAAAGAAAGGIAASTNPVGMATVAVVGGAIVVTGVWMGKGFLMKKAQETNIPVRMRKLSGTESYVLKKVRKRAEKDEIEKTGKAAYAEAFVKEAGDQIVKDVAEAVRTQLTDAAEKAAIMVRRRDA
jgi:hypothetical protein